MGEIVVVDAGRPTGRRRSCAPSRSGRPRCGSWRRREPPGRGRNVGIEVARAERIVTLDAGSRVGPRFVAALAAAADDLYVAVVA